MPLLGFSYSIILSIVFHGSILTVTLFTLPFLAKKPFDVPPLVSVELIQISDITNIPYAPKAAKIIDKAKKEEKLLTEKAPPKKVEKEDTKKVNLDKKKENIKKDQNKKVNLDLQKDNINQTKTKKVPTPETKKNLLKEDKPDATPMPDKKKEKTNKSVQKQQQPSKEIQKKVVDEEKKIKPKKKLKNDKIIKEFVDSKKPIKDDKKVKQVSEFEKKENMFDVNKLQNIINQAYESVGETKEINKKISQSQDSSMVNMGNLTLSEEDRLKAQIFGCWSVPLGLPYNEDLLVRIRLKLKQDGTIIDTVVLDRERMGKNKWYKVLVESTLRALTNSKCIPLEVPTSGYERWKELQLNFNPKEMLGG